MSTRRMREAVTCSRDAGQLPFIGSRMWAGCAEFRAD
jgi:hypothetical protein